MEIRDGAAVQWSLNVLAANAQNGKMDWRFECSEGPSFLTSEWYRILKILKVKLSVPLKREKLISKLRKEGKKKSCFSQVLTKIDNVTKQLHEVGKIAMAGAVSCLGVYSKARMPCFLSPFSGKANILSGSQTKWTKEKYWERRLEKKNEKKDTAGRGRPKQKYLIFNSSWKNVVVDGRTANF